MTSYDPKSNNWEELVGGYPIEDENIPELQATSTEPSVLMMGDLPERVDPRNHPQAGQGFLQVENQGSIGSCQGNSLTECGEFCYTLATGLVIQLSRMFAYLISQMADGIKGDRGSTLNGGTKAARDVGFCPESNAPYPSSYPGWSWVTSKMKELAAKIKLRSHAVIKTVDAAKQFLGSGLGVLQIGMGWNDYMQPDSDGCITNWRPTARMGGHAVTIVGYVLDSDVGRESGDGYWFLLKNSWGLRWGKRGYAYVSPRAMQLILGHQWTVLIGRSDMDTPTPRPIPVDFTKPSQTMYA